MVSFFDLFQSRFFQNEENFVQLDEFDELDRINNMHVHIRSSQKNILELGCGEFFQIEFYRI